MQTIFMPQEILDKWLAALRSGKYAQGQRYLKDDTGAYCCLGVLQMVCDGKTEADDETDALDDVGVLPTFEWLATHNIRFIGQFKTAVRNPWIDVAHDSAAGMNDELDGEDDLHRYTFKEIADAIEGAAKSPLTGDKNA